MIIDFDASLWDGELDVEHKPQGEHGHMSRLLSTSTAWSCWRQH